MPDPSFEARLARAKFRAWHRGTREADYMIGGYFDLSEWNWRSKPICHLRNTELPDIVFCGFSQHQHDRVFKISRLTHPSIPTNFSNR